LLYFKSMIKGRSPFPFETIAVAVSFSPGLESVIAEAKRLCQLHGSMAVFIHAGKKTSEKQRTLGNVLTSNGFHDGNSRVYWEPAGDVTSFLQVCKHEVVDLILAGCSERNNFELPAGKFASELASRSKCSVLFYCRQHPKGPFANIFVSTTEHRKTEWTVATAIYLSQKENAKQLVLFDESQEISYDNVATKAMQKWSPALRTALNQSSVKINHQTTGGISANEYAFQNHADLMIINSPDHHLRIFDRIFSNNVEKTLANPPCHLLIVHSRLQD
jgi:nucleotide-binding universal stress UspA family protein